MKLLHFPTRVLAVLLTGCFLSGVLSPSMASRPSAALLSPETEGSPIIEGSTVALAYHVTIPGDQPIDYDDVTQFVQGRHDIFPALEHQVAGMRPGEQKEVNLSPEEGFGRRDERKKAAIPRTELPPGAKIGDILQHEKGGFARVAAVSGSTALLDYNHPLAGKPLVVHVRIVKVDQP
jgi:FKBP-type peptidyl-prolyl cis-trans isomerase 2